MAATSGQYSDLPVLASQSCGWAGDPTHAYAVRLTINGAAIPGKGFRGNCAPGQRGAEAVIGIDALYAAAGGTYLDSEFGDTFTIITRTVLAFAAGKASPATSHYYTRALGVDRASAVLGAGYRLFARDAV